MSEPLRYLACEYSACLSCLQRNLTARRAAVTPAMAISTPDQELPVPILLKNSLPGLPVELLLIIWHLLEELGDIASFAQTCRQVQRAGEDILKKHQECIRKYSVLDKQQSKRNGSILASYLKHFLKDPDHARYVHTLTALHWKVVWEYPSNMFDISQHAGLLLFDDLPRRHLPYSTGDNELFKKEFDRLSWLPDRDKEWHMTSLMRGAEDPIVALLIGILPNLKRLHITFPVSDPYLFYRVVDGLASKKKRSLPLSQLVKVNIQGKGSSYDNFGLMARFAALSSVKTLIDQNMLSRDSKATCLRAPKLLAPLSSNAEHLSFQSCSIHSEHIFEFLRGFRALRSFSHIGSHPADTTEDPSGSSIFNPFWICAALVAHSKSTLKFLKLRSQSAKWRYMGSIMELENLEILETESNMLVRSGCFHNVHSILEALPPAIKDVRLHISTLSWGPTTVSSMMQALVEAKKDRLSSLTRVVIRQRYTFVVANSLD